MDNQIICSNCNQQYRDENQPRLLIGCGHTFCENCLITFIYQRDSCFVVKCPEDEIKVQIQEKCVNRFPKNLALLKVIESKKENLSFKQNEINVSKITKNSEIPEEEDATDLISIMDGTKLNISLTNEPKGTQTPQPLKPPQQLICPLHKKTMDIVCTVDLKKICASCAIFGEHKGHSFKSLEEISQIEKGYCQSIQKIMNEKQKLTKQISCTQTKNDLLSLLTTKRSKLKTKILDQFQKIETKIANKKKETLRKLDELVKKQETNFKNIMKFGEKLQGKYEKWEKKSNTQLKILQENDFQAKLILLFEGIHIDGDLIEEGESLISQMKNEEENIICEVEKKLQDLNVTIKGQVYDYIDDFVQVQAEPLQQFIPIVGKSQQQLIVNNQVNINQAVLTQNKGQPLKMKFDSIVSVEKKVEVKKYQETKNQYLQVNNPTNQHNLDQSLLENEEDQNKEPQKEELTYRTSVIMPPPNLRPSLAPLSERMFVQPNINIEPPTLEKNICKQKGLVTPANQLVNNDAKCEKMTKKRLSKMKLGEKYEKTVEALLADTLEILDLTNGEIGDNNTIIICENLAGSKVRTLKLIRNKLTDEGVAKMLPYLGSITTLNLSQNLLTENIIDVLAENKKYLPNIRTVILSQNKIIERKHRTKIQKLKKFEWNVSV